MNFLKLHKNKILKGIVLLFLVFMMVYPGAAFRGASSGLLLWFHNVLPNLLPFIIISNLIVRLNITRQISKLFYPIFGKLFGISAEGCYPIIFGFLSGIPMGAKSTADMVIEKKIPQKEGQFLVAMCNNASPMFIIGYIAITQLKLPHIKYTLFAIIYGSAIIAALLFRYMSNKFIKTQSITATYKTVATNPVKLTSTRFSFELLDSSIMNGFEIVTKIGGYIILFSILAQIIKEIGPNSGIIKAFLMGTLEITTGISQICSIDMSIQIKIVLVAVLTSFGGFSGIAQTKSVLQNSRLSIQSYVLVKLISAFIALIMAYLYVTLFSIQ